jgi:CheY-like chemotaxis protein/HPt (histidine-containing phosphotransfer) domain-containing protein
LAEKRPPKLQFQISDTGIGVQPKALKDIFSPFRQADNSMSRRFGGSGLGLAIVRDLVNLMGGEIRAESKPGIGSVFTIDLAVDIAHSARKLPNWLPMLRNCYVLVVAPEGLRSESWLAMLRWAGMEAERVSGKEAALAAIADCVPDGLLVSEIDPFMMEMRDAPLVADDVPVILVRDFCRGLLNAPLPAWASAELKEPFNDLALWRELAILWDVTKDESDTTQDDRSVEFDAKVLMVEDNDTNRLILEQILATLGCRVSSAVNGEEACAMVAAEAFDLVLMDVQMPIMDGLEATRQIRLREQNRGLSRQLVIALTANALNGDREMCLQAGMDDYVSKPVTIERIRTAMLRWLPAIRRSRNTQNAESGVAAVENSTPAVNARYVLNLPALRASLGKEADAVIPSVLNSYVREGGKQVAVLANLGDEFDVERVVRIVHNLKSASAAIGAETFSLLCKEAEQAARMNDWQRARPIIGQIVIAFPEVDRAVRAVLDELSGKAVA